MLIDFRSDTVTRPTEGMLKAMMSAQVGDDVFEEDPTVNALEEKIAGIFGMPAALFCPSGTMSNQIALKCHTQPGNEIICDELSHIYQYEGGGIGFNSGCSVKLLHGDRGRVNADMVKEAINNSEDIHKPISTLVSLENTSNRGGGSCYNFHDLDAIKNICIEHDLRFHLDGARIFNAIIAKQESPAAYGKLFDSISVCLSKGLGTPMGSVLLGDKTFIKKARRIRKVLGGGMRQIGYMAAAGIYALDNHIERLEIDHTYAKMLASGLASSKFVSRILPVDTNIVIFEVTEKYTAEQVVKALKNKNILAVAFSSRQVRMVLHLDINSDMLQYTLNAIEKM